MRKLILTVLLSFNVLAECPQNVQKVKNGTVANCDGWLVSEPTMQEMARNADVVETQKKLVQSMEHLRKLDLDEIEHYKKRSTEAHKALSQSEKQRFWVGVGAFALGVVLTGVAAKAAIEASK
jgi:hypothetical protein